MRSSALVRVPGDQFSSLFVLWEQAVMPEPKRTGQMGWVGEWRCTDWMRFPGGQRQAREQKAKFSHPKYDSVYRILQSDIFYAL